MSEQSPLSQPLEIPPDPRSWDYPRVFTRPSVNWRFVICAVLIFILCSFFLSIAVRHWVGVAFVAPILVCFFLVALLVWLRDILIFFVQIYQLIAPASIRSMCRFEPSCSTYMILSLRKHGAIQGLVRGVRRIYLCGHGGGGFDWPDETHP